MKKLELVALVLFIVSGIIGCKGNISDSRNSNDSKFNLVVTSEITDTLTIPNPATTEGTPEIVIHKCDYENSHSDDRWCVEMKKEQKYDLSFLGLGKREYINNYAVGNVTGSGDSLVLVVADKFFKNPNALDNNAYVVVLDYINKKSYVTRADFRAANGRDDQLNLCDITGDGIKEIIFSGQPNVALVWNVFKFDGNNLKEIYSNCKSAKLERDSFKAELLDDYKVKVKGIEFDYEYTFSLLDSGYHKQDLEYIDNPDWKYDNWGIRAYADGKVRELEENDKYQYGWYLECEFLKADNWDKGYAEYDYFKDINIEEGIHIQISLQLWTEKIGTMNIYLKYSAETDTLEINKMKFEPEVILN